MCVDFHNFHVLRAVMISGYNDSTFAVWPFRFLGYRRGLARIAQGFSQATPLNDHMNQALLTWPHDHIPDYLATSESTSVDSRTHHQSHWSTYVALLFLYNEPKSLPLFDTPARRSKPYGTRHVVAIWIGRNNSDGQWRAVFVTASFVIHSSCIGMILVTAIRIFI